MDKYLQQLEKEYFVIGKTRINSVFAWLSIAVLTAVISNSILVSQQMNYSKAIERDHIASALLKTTPSFPPPYAPGELLVKFKETVTDQKQQELVTQWGFTLKKELPQIKVKRFSVPQQAEESLAQSLSRNPQIEFVEVNGTAQGDLIPNDPSYLNQWHHIKISSPTGWDLNTGTPDVTIAIIDSGIDPTHLDLKDKLVPGYNFLGNNTDTQDVRGHGTSVGGSAAALTNNSLGVAGVAWQNNLMPLVVLNSDNFAYYSDIAEAVIYAADHNVRVMNISIGGTSYTSTVQSAVNYAWGKNAIVVAAAGNSNSSVPLYPAALNNVLAVSATTISDSKAGFSSYGDWVDISAPGKDILTTKKGGGYGNTSGTSFASPITAGLVALVISSNPVLTNAQVVEILKNNSDDLGTQGFDQYFGWGRINVQKALQASLSTTPPPSDTTPPITSITFPSNDLTVSGTITVSVKASNEGGVNKVELWKNGSLFNTDTTSPYSFAWNTINDSNASYTLQSKAYDLSNNVGVSSNITVIVSNALDSTPPTITIANPPAGSTLPFKGTTKITVQASDNTGIMKIDIYFDNSLYTSCVNTTTCTYNLNIHKISTGIHTISAKATDTSNLSNTTSITVNK